MALLGEGGPLWELRGEFLGEILGEAPFLGEGLDGLRGDSRNDGRVLGETDRNPPDEGVLERGFDGVRDRGGPLLEGVAAAGDLSRPPACTSRLYRACAARFRSCCARARYAFAEFHRYA